MICIGNCWSTAVCWCFCFSVCLLWLSEFVFWKGGLFYATGHFIKWAKHQLWGRYLYRCSTVPVKMHFFRQSSHSTNSVAQSLLDAAWIWQIWWGRLSSFPSKMFTQVGSSFFVWFTNPMATAMAIIVFVKWEHSTSSQGSFASAASTSIMNMGFVASGQSTQYTNNAVFDSCPVYYFVLWANIL